MKARVFVTLKPSVFDPQGRTITDALQSLGYAAIADVRQGKYFEVEIAATSEAEARSLAEEVAARVLANPVIERFWIEFAPAAEPPVTPRAGRVDQVLEEQR